MLLHLLLTACGISLAIFLLRGNEAVAKPLILAGLALSTLICLVSALTGRRGQAQNQLVLTALAFLLAGFIFFSPA